MEKVLSGPPPSGAAALPHPIHHTPSFLDVQQVEKESAEAANGAVSVGTLVDNLGASHSHSALLKRSKLSTVCNLLNGQQAVQEHENETAEIVIVCEPEASSLMMGGLHPRGSLYERPVNIDSAKKMHHEFRRVLREHGLKVLTVREILSYNVESNISSRVDLEDLVIEALDYDIAAGHKLEDLAEADRFFVSDKYKREVVEQMGISQLIDTLMIQPTVHLTPSYRDTGLTAAYTFEPLSNLVYTRDQQVRQIAQLYLGKEVTTSKGIVMGRLRSLQRQREVKIMKFCFVKLGLTVVGDIDDPGYLEGGDFFPLGADLALLGIGLRSNLAAAEQLMSEDLLGTRRFAVVRDDFDRHQDRMHLDCVFSVVSDNCCIMLEDIIGEASPTRRLVDEYVRCPGTGKYSLHREGVEFSAYIKEEGYAIIPITGVDQLAYACNVLNLGNSRIISVHAGSARQLVKSPHFQGDVQVIDFSSITSMYGSVHCASQVVKRMPRRVSNAVMQAAVTAATAAAAQTHMR